MVMVIFVPSGLTQKSLLCLASSYVTCILSTQCIYIFNLIFAINGEYFCLQNWPVAFQIGAFVFSKLEQSMFIG